MPFDHLADPADPQPGWQLDHIRRYLATGGEDGYLWDASPPMPEPVDPPVPTLLLTTRGTRTGRPRRTALIFGRDGDRYVVVGSKGGTPSHPFWYRNLSQDPRVRVQVRDEVFDAVARTATGEERSRLWAVMNGIWPSYDQYQAGTSREIPVVVLEPAGS